MTSLVETGVEIARPLLVASRRPLRIALIAPLYEAVPPKLYGGTERVVAWLADALVELGHEVTLFASADTATRARLVAVRDCAIRLDPATLKSDMASHLAELDEVRRQADSFDVLHFHIDMLHFPFFEDVAERTVTTIHGRLDMKDLAGVYRRWASYPLVSISDSQRLHLPFANWAATVYHGLPERQLHFTAAPRGDYLAFLGRISPEKRPDRAIAMATRCGVPLKIAAKVDAVDRAYFEQHIEPLLDNPLVEYIGEIGDAAKSEFLGNARALLFPIDWPEPFGLAMIEAMACGTPVIAWNCGSVPEVVDHGATGLIVADEQEADAAVAAVTAVNREGVRRQFEARFTSRVMARNYLSLYGKAAEKSLLTADTKYAG